MNIGFRTSIGSLVAALMPFVVATAHAAPVTSTPTSNNFITFDFTMPAQPDSHRAIQFSLTTSSGPSSSVLSTVATLYNNGVQLGTGTFSSAFFGRFAEAPLIQGNFSPIDFDVLRAGTQTGSMTLRLMGTGSVNWNTSQVAMMTFGEGGGFAATFPTISNLTVSTAPPVPEPEQWMALLAGLGLVGWRSLAHRQGMPRKRKKGNGNRGLMGFAT